MTNKNNSSKILTSNKVFLVFSLVVSVMFVATTSTLLALAPEKQADDFPSKEAFDQVYKQGNNIGEDLCKDSRNKSNCIKGYRQEYVFLAFQTCDKEVSKTKKDTCYKNFARENTHLGEARQAAGYDPDQRVDGNTPKANSFNTSGLDGTGDKADQCGKGENAVRTKFNFGCVGNEYKGATLNPILDLMYTLIRFLSAGVGVVVVGSIIWAGIQYSSSQGNPEQTAQAKNRIQNAIVGLILYMFAYALIQYLVPGGLFT